MIEAVRTERLYHPDTSSIVGLTKEAIFSIYGRDRFRHSFYRGRLAKPFDTLTSHAFVLEEEVKTLQKEKNDSLVSLREAELKYLSSLIFYIEKCYPFLQVHKKTAVERPVILLAKRRSLIEESKKLGLGYWSKVE
jgi:hypothetical protein